MNFEPNRIIREGTPYISCTGNIHLGIWPAPFQLVQALTHQNQNTDRLQRFHTYLYLSNTN